MSDQTPTIDPTDKSAVRDAATLILIRTGEAGGAPRVLLGQRGRSAAFMPNKFVFPGGALDPEDAAAETAGALDRACADRLTKPVPPAHPVAAFACAAIRETFEETGLRLGVAAAGPPTAIRADDSYAAFGHDGARPALSTLRYVFRAITPPGQPRRFDARFFVASAAALLDDPDDFAAASGELSHLTWAPLPEARAFALPFITSVVLAEVQTMLDEGWDPSAGAPPPERPVPFFRHDADDSEFVSL